MPFKFLMVMSISILSSTFVTGQKVTTKDSLTVKIMLTKTVKNNNDLQAKIIVKNVSTIPVSVYKDLRFGDFIGNLLVFDRTNFALILEEKKEGKYVQNARKTKIDFALPGEDTLDDREKIILVPQDSIVYSFHADEISGFRVGSHRIRCFYTNQFQGTKGIPSKWFYFQVLNEIYPKHDYQTNWYHSYLSGQFLIITAKIFFYFLK